MSTGSGVRNALALAAALFMLAGCARGLRDFNTDGCSLFPDKDFGGKRRQWCGCCVAHDLAYWRGGTAEERMRADEQLRDCVLEKTNDPALAELMYAGVRAGGHPAFPTWYRWGYGWPYGRGYEPLAKEERAQVRDRLAAYQARLPDSYCGPRLVDPAEARRVP